MLPGDKSLNINCLSRIFINTVATYKFYWFASILDFVVKKQQKQISFWELITSMVAKAWYPVHYYHLSFGKSDSLYQQIMEIHKELNIPIDAGEIDIRRAIISNLQNPHIQSLLRIFKMNVPYRFLSPWIRYQSDEDVVRQSLSYTNDCLYKIENESITINPAWQEYLNEHYSILQDFMLWNLTTFLQKRNPNVPNIAAKIVKPIQRDSLLKQHHYWDKVIQITGPIHCIYTNKLLYVKQYDLDHFIPWSFVTHDLIWDLLPADPSINSSKSNNLPSLDKYLSSYARMHQNALQIIYREDSNNKLLEDYLILHDSISELVYASEENFYNLFKKTFLPMTQIAENMGFCIWQS